MSVNGANERKLGHPGRIVIVQALLGVVSTLTFLAISFAQAHSALIAVGCVVIPTAYYAWVSSRTLHATRLLFHGVLRMVLTGVLMAVVIVSIGIEPVGFFTTFGLIQLAYLVPGSGNMRYR